MEVPLYYVPCVIVGNGDTSFSASLNGQNFEYTSMLVRFFVSQVDVSYDLLVKFTRKFFFMISSALPLKYHKEGKRKTTEAFSSIYLSGNLPEKWHPVHRFISLHSLQWYRVPTIQPPHPSHHTLKNKEFYLSFTLMFTKYWASYSINCGLEISWAWDWILMPYLGSSFICRWVSSISLSSKTNMFRFNSIKNIPDG